MVQPIAAMLVRVTDIAKSEEFYSNVLGITFQETGANLRLAKLSNLTIVLQAGEQPKSTTAVAFVVDDLDAMTKAVTQGGGRILGGRYEGAFGEATLLADPDGLRLEFVRTVET